MVTLPVIVLLPVPPVGPGVLGVHEADERVETRRAELDEERRLARLHPVVLQLRALDGRGLRPAACARGRHGDDAELAGGEVLDERGPVGAGEDDARARRWSAGERVLQRVAVDILAHRPARDAVAALRRPRGRSGNRRDPARGDPGTPLVGWMSSNTKTLIWAVGIGCLVHDHGDRRGEACAGAWAGIGAPPIEWPAPVPASLGRTET